MFFTAQFASSHYTRYYYILFLVPSLLQPLLRDRDLQRTFMAMDTDGEGGITFEEFEAFLLSNATVQIVEEDERVFQEEMRKEQEMKKNIRKET